MRPSRWQERALEAAAVMLLLVLPAAWSPATSYAQGLQERVKIPLYEWTPRAEKPKAVIVALHGATLHGGSFTALGKQLSAEGFVVIAPDMRGFGTWYHGGKETEMRFVKTEEDLAALLTAIRKEYPALPVFVAGESLGANWALLAAAQSPELVDGLILSSPSLRRQSILSRHVFKEFFVGLLKPHKPIDVSHHIRRGISENPEIVEERLNDPLARNKLSMVEMLKMRKFMSNTMEFAADIPARLPVLIFQGTSDRLMKPESVDLLQERLASRDQTVKYLEDRGHIHLETDHIKPDVVEALRQWLSSHAKGGRSVTTAREPAAPGVTETADAAAPPAGRPE